MCVYARARAKNECVSRRRKRILSLVSQCSTDATCSHHGMNTVCTRIPLRLIYAWRTYPFTERLCDRLRYSYMRCSPIRNRPRGAAASSPSSRHWASCMVDIRFVHVFLTHVAINVVSTFLLLTPCSPRHFPPFACCVPLCALSPPPPSCLCVCLCGWRCGGRHDDDYDEYHHH